MATDYTDIIRRMQSQSAGTQVALQSERNPADVARARRLSRYTNTPAPMVEGNFAPYEAEVLRRQTEDAVRDNPWMAQYLGQPDNAAIAKKDIPKLATASQLLGGTSDLASVVGYRDDAPLAPSFQRNQRDFRELAGRARSRVEGRRLNRDLEANFAERTLNTAEGMVMGGVMSAAGGLAGASQFVMDSIGLGDETAAFFEGERQTREHVIAETTPTDLNTFGEGIYSGGQSLVALGIAATTGSPLLALTGMSGFEAYSRFRGRGATSNEALAGGAATAAIEYATERLPVGFLLNSFGKTGAKKFLTNYLISDVLGEQAATIGQSYIDAIMPGGEGVTAWREQVDDRAIQTLISSLAMGGAIGVGSAVMSRLQPQVRAVEQMEQGLASQAFVDRLMETAEGTEMRKLDPESYADFVEKAVTASGAPVRHLYLPIEAVEAYFQSEGADQQALAPFSAQIDEAIRTRGDIVIPLADAAAHLAGTPTWQAIREDVRTAPNGMSGREAREQGKTFYQELETRGAEIAAEAAAEAEAQSPVVDLYEELRNEMVAAGYDERTASANAQVLAARYERLTTARYGDMTLAQARERFPVQFRTAAPGEGPARRALEQSDRPTLQSAIKYKGKIYKGKTHLDALDEIADPVARADAYRDGNNRGYVNERGRYLNRFKAQEYAVSFGLISKSAPSWAATSPELISENLEDIDEQLRVFNQDLEAGGVRGQAQFPGDGAAIITLFATANRSTLIHELGHVFLEQEMALASAKGASPELKADMDRLKEWFKANGHPVRKRKKGAKGRTLKQTSAFGRWFGESKVVDESGQPLVVYHGTPAAEIDAFKGKSWFAENEALAQTFTKGRSRQGKAGQVLATHLSIKNPLLLDRPISGAWTSHEWAEKLGLSRDEFLARMPEGFETNVHWRMFDTPEFVDLLKSLGYDGVRAKETHEGWRVSKKAADVSSVTWLAFEPTQIKSVDNTGTFDPNDPRILNQGPAAEDGDFEIPVEAHELFARGFERYVMEGKAPSAELRGAFAAFRSWLLRIYQVVENLRSPITPDVREVFSRMLATQEAIDANRDTATPLSDEALDRLGLSAEERAAYIASVADARDAAYDALLFKTMEAVRRKEQARLKDVQANIRAEVTTEVNALPEFVALHLLRTGKWLGQPDREGVDVKLNTGWLIDTYGEDILTQLPKGLPITHGAGLPGDEIAEMVGLPSGDDLVQALVGMRVQSEALKAAGEKRSVRQVMIEKRVDEIMADRYGDALTDGRIEEEAVAAINSARQGEILSGELRQINRKAPALDRAPTPYQIAREWARRKISAGRVVDVASRTAIQRYTRATARAAKAAEAAILADDMAEAFRQKQAQMLNHALLAEAKAIADQVDEIVRRMQRYAGRAAMKSVDQDYLDQVHGLLERFDFRKRSQTVLTEKQRFEEWAAGRQAEGFEVHVPPRLAAIGDHYSRVTVEDLIALDDAVKSIIFLGRKKQTYLDRKEEREFSLLEAEVVENLRALPDRKLPDNPSVTEERFGAGLAAPLLKMEEIVLEMDNGNVNGPLTRLFIHRAADNANLKADLVENTILPLVKLYNALSSKARARMGEKVTSDSLTWNTVNEGDTRQGSPVTMTRLEWLVVALNTGNISSLEKITKGERWPVTVLQSELNRILSKDDWQFVETAWRQLDSLWPHIVENEREMSGIVPEQVIAMEIETPHGPVKGGYWPVVYDSGRSKVAEKNEQDKANDLFGLKSGVATAKGYTITRTNAVGPMNYNFEQIILQHLDEVATRIAYTVWIRDVLRAMAAPRISGLLKTKLGVEYEKQLLPWVRRVVNPNQIDRRGSGFWNGKAKAFRINLSVTAMGFAYSTGAAQTLGLLFSAGKIGPKYVALGLYKMLGKSGVGAGLTGAGAGFISAGPVGMGIGGSLGAISTAMTAGPAREMQEFVFSRSPEMARRGQELNREMVEVLQNMRLTRKSWMGKAKQKISGAQALAFWHIGMIDRYIVSMPTWLGAHQKGLDEGMSDEDASRYADSMVRLSQGSGQEKDLSAIQSGNNEFQRYITMFYTPFNVMFNAQWRAVRDARKGEYMQALQNTFWFMIATTLADALSSGDWPEGEEGEPVGFDDLGMWFMRNFAFGLAGGVPIARDASNYIERDLTGKYSNLENPISQGVEAIWKAGKESAKVWQDEKEVDGAYIRGLANAIGYGTGIPGGGQLGKTGGFVWDYNTGAQDPQSVRDWYSGITYGRLPEDKEASR